jgi:hypothetical protein
MSHNTKMAIIIADFTMVIISVWLILQPPIQTWAGNYLMRFSALVQSWLNPPQKVAFSTSGSNANSPFNPITPGSPLIDSLNPFQDTAPIPATCLISGGTYFTQHNLWNYCGPATLAMLLSYQNWTGTPTDIAQVIKPYAKDKNVEPSELLDFIKSVGLDGVVRVGGDLELLKRLIANGYPVMVEKGPHFQDILGKITWMGHYQVLNGYNDNTQFFTAQDSYVQADFPQSYAKLIEEWRSFNYTYLVAFKPEKRNDVLKLLGPDADETINFQRALKKAGDEAQSLTGVDQFFAFYNYGTNLVSLLDYEGAAKAYDTAFALYDLLPASLSIRPYRILWYQTGPFLAYFYTGRYNDVIVKATQNSIDLVRDDVPALEESYYWRGMAEIQLGEKQKGIDDFDTCLKYHTGFMPCVIALNDLGIYP